MRIMGIDLGNPGALAILSDDQPGKPRVVATASWGHTTGLHLQEMILALGREHGVELVATERPGSWGRRSVGMSQRGKQEVVRAACQALRVHLVDYQPRTIRAALGVRAQAAEGKRQVGRCVKLLVKIDSDNEHVLDACALALVALNREGSRRRMLAAKVRSQL